MVPDLALLINLTAKLNELNADFQGQNKTIIKIIGATETFRIKHGTLSDEKCSNQLPSYNNKYYHRLVHNIEIQCNKLYKTPDMFRRNVTPSSGETLALCYTTFLGTFF